MLLTDIVIDGIPEIDWTLHIPTMLHILFLGLDHTRPIVRDHCKQLVLNLLIVLSKHNDHLTVAKVLLNSQTTKLSLGLTIPLLLVTLHNFTELDPDYDAYLYNCNANVIASTSNSGTPTSGVTTILQVGNASAGPSAPVTSTTIPNATSASSPAISNYISSEWAVWINFFISNLFSFAQNKNL